MAATLRRSYSRRCAPSNVHLLAGCCERFCAGHVLVLGRQRPSAIHSRKQQQRATAALAIAGRVAARNSRRHTTARPRLTTWGQPATLLKLEPHYYRAEVCTVAYSGMRHGLGDEGHDDRAVPRGGAQAAGAHLRSHAWRTTCHTQRATDAPDATRAQLVHAHEVPERLQRAALARTDPTGFLMISGRDGIPRATRG